MIDDKKIKSAAQRYCDATYGTILLLKISKTGVQLPYAPQNNLSIN